MGFFDWLFDFNRDGKVSFGEKAFGFGMAAAILDAAEKEEQARLDLEAADDLEATFDDLDTPDFDECSRVDLEDKLDELRSRMDDLELQEPDDIMGAAYEVWEEKHSELEELIEDLEDRLND